MPVAQPSCRLIVAIEANDTAGARLEAALDGNSVACVLILPAAAQSFQAGAVRPLVVSAQRAGAAALIFNDADLARTLDADGVHLSLGEPLSMRYAEARQLLGAGSIVAGDAGRSRDAAMRLGEAGADYVGFGVPDFVTDKQTAAERRLELIQWWAEIFEVPCVALDVGTASDAERLARAGADFVAIHLPPSVEGARDATLSTLAALSPPGARRSA